jgi:hypothetical protein
LGAGFLDSDRAISANRHETLAPIASRSFGTEAHKKGLRACRFDPQAEALQVSIPNQLPRWSRLGSRFVSLKDVSAIPLVSLEALVTTW